MKINLNLLKFHSFYHNKKFTNKCNKKNFPESIKKDIMDKIASLKDFGITEIEREEKRTYFWKTEESRTILEKIIQREHHNLYNEIHQRFIEKNPNTKFLQIHIKPSSKELLVCIYDEKEDTIFPIILDLNHFFHKVNKNKPFSYKYEKHWKMWDYKSNQEKIKQEIYNKI